MEGWGIGEEGGWEGVAITRVPPVTEGLAPDSAGPGRLAVIGHDQHCPSPALT